MVYHLKHLNHINRKGGKSGIKIKVTLNITEAFSGYVPLQNGYKLWLLAFSCLLCRSQCVPTGSHGFAKTKQIINTKIIK